MNNEPKISVVIPTYNRKNLLPRAIKSVLSQTFKDFELIVVDDGSTDNKKGAAKKFQEQYKMIKCIHHEKKEIRKQDTKLLDFVYLLETNVTFSSTVRNILSKIICFDSEIRLTRIKIHG